MGITANRKMNQASQRIDVRHHILPPDYILGLKRMGIPGKVGVALPKWSPAESLAVMDAHGIVSAVTSISTPGVYFGDPAEARDLARRCNEYAARLAMDHPGRFGAFASLPLPDVEGALRELEYALDKLKLDGVILFSNVGGRYLGDPAYDELFAELGRRRSVVFIHPNDPPSIGMNPFVEYPHDATRAVANMMYKGVLRRYAKIRFVLAHAGGTVPFASSRILGVGMSLDESLLGILLRMMRGLAAYKRMYYDTAASTDRYALQSLTGHARTSRLLFGTNYVWTPSSVIAETIRELHDYEQFNLQSLAAIERENALKMFPRFAA